MPDAARNFFTLSGIDMANEWADFKADKTNFDPVQIVLQKALEGGKFGEPNDGTNIDLPTLVDVTDIYLVRAKNDIRLDMESTLGLRIGDVMADAAVDAFVTLGSGTDRIPIMKRLLATKQIALAYMTLSKREDDKFADDLRFWAATYERLRAVDINALRRPAGSARVRVIGVG